MRILAINTGSTSTKTALFEDERELWSHARSFSAEELAPYSTVIEQKELRLKALKEVLKEKGVELSSIDAIAGRGGMLRPIPGGTYKVNELMLLELTEERYGSHASNLGALLAQDLANEGGCNRAYIVDPVVVDELAPVARISGIPQIERRAAFHALNQKAMARRYARETGRSYEELNLLVAHIGGGITVGAHKRGKVVDVNHGQHGDGPFTPERSGGLPASRVAELCFSGQYTRSEIRRLIENRGGMIALLGTNDLREVERRIAAGDSEAKLVLDSMIYQIAKEIGAHAAVLKGKVDAVILTGGMVHSEYLRGQLEDYVKFIAPVAAYPGEDELKALAEGALRVLSGKEKAKVYQV